MKKALLLFVVGIGTLSFGQNVTENKVSFNYIQLPTNPISTDYNTFDVIVEKKYEQANEDSLAAYQIRLDMAQQKYDAELNAWREKNKVVWRDYYTKMAAWQKQVNAGNTAAPKPTDPILTPRPVMDEVREPNMHSDIEDGAVKNAISLAGYDRGEGGATITIGILPVSNVNVTMKKSGSGTSTKYTYTANYRLPFEVKVEDPASGVVLQTILMNSNRTSTIGTYASQYEYDLWLIDNREQFWPDLEKKARNSGLQQVNNHINDKCGFPVKSNLSEVYTVKKFKEHQYSDLTNAYTVASQGYQMVGQSRDRKGCHSKLIEAIKIWETALKESNPGDKKSRVNDKVTALLYVNIGEAYMWMSNFDQAEIYFNQAIGMNVRKFKKRAESLKSYMNERKMRWNTNY